jgi:hypothetical protein
MCAPGMDRVSVNTIHYFLEKCQKKLTHLFIGGAWTQIGYALYSIMGCHINKSHRNDNLYLYSSSNIYK